MSINVGKLIAQMIAMFVVFALVLFIPAGTISWVAGWVFLTLFFGGTIALSFWLYRYNPELLHERMTGLSKADQKAWDRILIRLTGVLFMIWLAMMPLDAVRFRWSYVPVWGQAVGCLIILCSFYLFYITFRENPYLSPAERIQKERGQTVISTGPYSYVRHPMYAAFILFMIGTCLLMGSLYGLLGGMVLVGMIIRRALLEEMMLVQELPGYDDYMARVRYRLIPYLW